MKEFFVGRREKSVKKIGVKIQFSSESSIVVPYYICMLSFGLKPLNNIVKIFLKDIT